MVSWWSQADRRELARLCAEHDQMMTEHEQWMARREAASGAPVQKSDEPSVLYRVTDNNSLQPAPEPDAEPSDTGVNFFGDERDEQLIQAIGEVIYELRKEWRAEIKAAIDKRDTEIAHLRGQVETLTRLYAGKSADVVDLPNWRPKDVA